MSTNTNTASEPEFEYVCASLWPSGALNPYTYGRQVQRGNTTEAEDFRLYCEGQTGKPQAIYRLVSDDALRTLAAERDALRAALEAERERCARLVPTNWLDPLLTGHGSLVPATADCRVIERILKAVQERIRSTPKDPT